MFRLKVHLNVHDLNVVSADFVMGEIVALSYIAIMLAHG